MFFENYLKNDELVLHIKTVMIFIFFKEREAVII